jgi:hypothetical protein
MAEPKSTKFEGEGVVEEAYPSIRQVKVRVQKENGHYEYVEYDWSGQAPVARYASQLQKGDKIRFKGDAQHGRFVLDFIEVTRNVPGEKRLPTDSRPLERPAGNDDLQAIVERKKAQYLVFWNEAKKLVSNEFPSASPDAKLEATHAITATWFIDYILKD